MAFNLAEAAGFGSMMSNLDTREIVNISIALIEENDKNFFAVDDVQDLKDSIAINGILQPILVVADGDHYRIIAGHRRKKAAFELLQEGKSEFKEIPCVILPKMSEAMEWTTLIQTNTAARELSYPEKMKAAQQLKATIIQLRDEGVNIPGKMRDILSEQLEISRTELARMDVIAKNLHEYWKKQLEAGTINASCAYELARMSKEDQSDLVELYTGPEAAEQSSMCAAVAQSWREKMQCKDWIRSDCKYADGYWASECRTKGKPVPCHGYQSVLKRKQKGHPEKCCGCCGECPNVMTCKDACVYGKEHHASKRRTEQANAETNRRKDLFAASKYPGFVTRLRAAIKNSGLPVSEIVNRQREAADNVGKQQFFSVPLLQHAMDATTAFALPDWAISVDSLCSVLKITPNWLFGFAEKNGWKSFEDEKPAEGQKVIIRRQSIGGSACGEYIYRNNRWYNPGLEDFEMNITGVTHWIDCPE